MESHREMMMTMCDRHNTILGRDLSYRLREVLDGPWTADDGMEMS